MNRLCLVLSLLPVLFVPVAAVADSFRLIYEPARGDLAEVREVLIDSEHVDQIVEDLEEIFNLPSPVVIVFNDEVDWPYYADGQVIMTYGFVADVWSDMEASMRLSDEELLILVLDIVEFVLHHEIGHALIDMLDLPVLGKEEDAVDGFAAIIAGHLDLDEVATAGATWFHVLARQQRRFSREDFHGRHSLDQQRTFRTICLIYGSSPDANAYLLRNYQISSENAAECIEDYEQSLDGWSQVLDPYLR